MQRGGPDPHRRLGAGEAEGAGIGIDEAAGEGAMMAWFEIPVRDLDRAAAFYAARLGVAALANDEPQPGRRMAFLPSEEAGVGGALVSSATSEPAGAGTTVNLNATGLIEAAVDRVAPAGGTVLMPVSAIGACGRIALLSEFDGNVAGLHSGRVSRSGECRPRA